MEYKLDLEVLNKMAVSDYFNLTNSTFGDVYKKTFGIVDPPVRYFGPNSQKVTFETNEPKVRHLGRHNQNRTFLSERGNLGNFVKGKIIHRS